MLRLGGLLLGGLALACFAAYPYLQRLASPALAESDTRPRLAGLESIAGEVSVRQHDSAAWKAASASFPLAEGDMVRTGRSGSARIKFTSGETVTVPPETIFSLRPRSGGPVQLATAATAPAAKKGAPAPAADAAPAAETSTAPQPTAPRPVVATQAPRPAPAEPTLVIGNLAWFGNTLQVVGRIDPGNTLMINDERVETAPDGAFKHLTAPYSPDEGSPRVVVLTTKDLAGRVKTITRPVPAQ